MVAFNFDSFYLAFLKYRGSRRHDRFSEAQTMPSGEGVSRRDQPHHNESRRRT